MLLFPFHFFLSCSIKSFSVVCDVEEVCITLAEGKADASICEPEALNVIYLASQIPFCFLNRFHFIRDPSMEPTVWTQYEKGVCSQAGYFSKHVSESVYCCLFLHSGVFRLVIFQCYDAKVTPNEL